jgi:hypothetical protein
MDQIRLHSRLRLRPAPCRTPERDLRPRASIQLGQRLFHPVHGRHGAEPEHRHAHGVSVPHGSRRLRAHHNRIRQYCRCHACRDAWTRHGRLGSWSSPWTLHRSRRRWISDPSGWLEMGVLADCHSGECCWRSCFFWGGFFFLPWFSVFHFQPNDAFRMEN